jgi:small redox-active disulfide protein 2
VITIEVFGPGCQKCQATEAAVHQALLTLGIQATVTHVRDPKDMAKAQVMFTPAVRINGEVKCTGRVPQVAEITTWLATAAANADA